jgi:hypothetical protein
MAWGALTDHFGILAIVDGAGTLADKLELKSSPKTAIAKSRSDAPDENNDIAAATWYGAPGTMFEASSTFVVKTGTFSLALLKLGEITSGKIVNTISVATSNGALPTITFTGRLGCLAVAAPTSKTNLWTLPDIDIVGIKAAQNFGGSSANGFTVSSGTSCIGSGLEFSIEFYEETDGLGVPVAHGVSGGVGTLSAQIKTVTDPPGWTLDTSLWTSTQEPGVEEEAAEYPTGNATAETVLTRDAA